MTMGVFFVRIFVLVGMHVAGFMKMLGPGLLRDDFGLLMLLFCEMIAFEHVNFSARDSAAVYSLNAERSADVEGGSCFVEHLRWYAGIDQSTQEHVACDTGKTIKISNTHSEVSLCHSPGAEAMADTGSTSFIEPDR